MYDGQSIWKDRRWILCVKWKTKIHRFKMVFLFYILFPDLFTIDLFLQMYQRRISYFIPYKQPTESDLR